jgi:hypothetical protein
MLKPIALETGIDVFMYLTANPANNDVPWDGTAFNYEPKLGDTTGCEIFSKSDLFQNTGNKFFCLIEPEIELMNSFILNNTMWKTCSHVTYKEQVLQQLYALFRANLGVKQYMVSQGFEYKYKIRLRPDTAVVKEFPRLSTLDFGPSSQHCQGTILYANKHIYKSGNEDWFNIGLASDMDHLLDRYIDFVATPFLSSSRKPWWDLEDHLTGLMQQRYKVCMRPQDNIWMVADKYFLKNRFYPLQEDQFMSLICLYKEDKNQFNYCIYLSNFCFEIKRKYTIGPHRNYHHCFG